MDDPGENISRDEVRKEFQLERMVLFSDAVFAIVITLMAIEIRLPDLANIPAEKHTSELIKQILPEFGAYALSFYFVGVIWNQHLKYFSLLKDYDQGIIVRNLVLLFFVGLFPFSATIIANVIGKECSSFLSLLIYFSVVFLCLAAQYLLQQYILISHPELRIKTDVSSDLEELQKKKKSLVVFAISIVLIFVTTLFISNEDLKPLAILWSLPLIFLEKILNRKKKVPQVSKN